MSDMLNSQAILVGIAKSGSEVKECEVSLQELERLLNTAGADCFAKVIQIKESYDARTVIGKGKVEEISELCKNNNIELVVFDVDLSPMQIRNLENDIEVATVIDRSMLILDIFALHATSGEGKLQVELAQLKYSAPRLTGKGRDLSRQGGGIGSRGPGESKLETDRRHLHEKTAALEAKIKELESNRSVMRAQRDKSLIPKIALVGYTNAGKSSLMNAISDANVLAEDKLFATLDSTTRKTELPSGVEILLTDTVGFIRKLPHNLIKAFKSTLDEVRYADILLIVCDISDSEAFDQLKVTEEVISELGAGGKTTLYVFNKCDMTSENSFPIVDKEHVIVSAKTGYGIDLLKSKIDDIIRQTRTEASLLIPYDNQSLINVLYKDYTVVSVDYVSDGVKVVAVLDNKGLGLFKKYII